MAQRNLRLQKFSPLSDNRSFLRGTPQREARQTPLRSPTSELTRKEGRRRNGKTRKVRLCKSVALSLRCVLLVGFSALLLAGGCRSVGWPWCFWGPVVWSCVGGVLSFPVSKSPFLSVTVRADAGWSNMLAGTNQRNWLRLVRYLLQLRRAMALQAQRGPVAHGGARGVYASCLR